MRQSFHQSSHQLKDPGALRWIEHIMELWLAELEEESGGETRKDVVAIGGESQESGGH